MNKRRVKRAVLLTGLVSVLIAGVFGLSLRSYRHQEALDRQLIFALKKQDPKQALALVNAGADPNAPVEPPPPPSLTELWNYLIHRRAMPDNDKKSAFHLACGAYTFHSQNNYYFAGLNTDEPYLLEMMLQHGAQKNAKDSYGRSPLFWSATNRHPKTVEILLRQGVDVNAQNSNGDTSLCWAVLTFSVVDPSERIERANVVRQLLAHGADPNLADRNGDTPLHVAQQDKRSDLVALLKQAGAKK